MKHQLEVSTPVLSHIRASRKFFEPEIGTKPQGVSQRVSGRNYRWNEESHGSICTSFSQSRCRL